MNFESMLKRFEQQLAAFEELHAGELREFEQKLAAYRQLHADEVRLLREELEALKKELAAREASEPPPTSPALENHAASQESTLTRRRFLGGLTGHRDA